jgi:hypothetical protein
MRAIGDWSKNLWVEVRGDDVAQHAGCVLPRMLADATGLTKGLSAAVSRPSADIVRPEPQPLGGLHRLRTLENLRQRRHLEVGSPVSIDSSNCGGRISSVWVSLTSRNSPSRIETVRLGRVEPGGDR